MHQSILTLAVVCTLVIIQTPGEIRADQPNIILVMADDQGWGDMGYNGHPHLRTPNFDDAVKKGINFTRFYAAAPVCSPTRASVLTGRHPNRMGVFKWGFPIRPQEVTIAEILKQHGYATAHFGKWHLGSLRHDSKATPASNGFDYWISSPNYYDNDPVLCNNGKAVEYKGESSIVTVDLAIDWIKKQSQTDSPFFAVVWFGSPHAPHTASETDSIRYSHLQSEIDAEKLPKNTIDFLGEVSGMDRAYGKLRKCLRQNEIENNTIVWYISDNGALSDVGSAGDFRGHKGQIYEGGLLVPSILHWPERFKGPQSVEVRCNSCDILPTLLELAAIKHEANRPMDGESLVRLVTETSSATISKPSERQMGFWDYNIAGRGVPADKLMREMLQAQSKGSNINAPAEDANADKLPGEEFDEKHFKGHSAWIKGDWKLHRIENENGDVRVELYNLKVDETESNNLVDSESDRADEMMFELADWLKSVAKSYTGKDYKP